MIVDYVAEAVFDLTAGRPPEAHLDMGAGVGDLIKRLRVRYPGLKSCAVDYNPGVFPLKDVPMGQADLNRDSLPYPEGRFDLVTCTEVFEHLENYRHALREAGRVTQAGRAVRRLDSQRPLAQIPVGVLHAGFVYLL